MDIHKAPLYQLMGDRNASVYDNEICKMAMVYGATVYSGGSITRRIEVNEQVIEKIDAELTRRNVIVRTGDK